MLLNNDFYCQNHPERINTLCGRVQFPMLHLALHPYSYHQARTEINGRKATNCLVTPVPLPEWNVSWRHNSWGGLRERHKKLSCVRSPSLPYSCPLTGLTACILSAALSGCVHTNRVESSPIQSSPTLESRGVHTDRVESSQVSASPSGFLVLFEQSTSKIWSDGKLWYACFAHIMWRRRWRRKRRNMWVHPINIKRPDFEIFSHLYPDLLEVEEKFHGVF